MNVNGGSSSSPLSTAAQLAVAVQAVHDKDLRELDEALERKRVLVQNDPNNNYDVLQDTRASLERFLAARFGGVGTVVEIVPNPYAQPGRPLYNRFVEEWQKVHDQTVELGFHGTAEKNIEAICKSGLKTDLRSVQVYGAGKQDRLGRRGRRGCWGCRDCLDCLDCLGCLDCLDCLDCLGCLNCPGCLGVRV